MNDVICSALAEKIIQEINLCKSLYSICPAIWDNPNVAEEEMDKHCEYYKYCKKIKKKSEQ